MIGDEPIPPYERPPLFKDYLARENTFERILIRQQAFWAERAGIASEAGNAAEITNTDRSNL